jgi:hypothetical protein
MQLDDWSGGNTISLPVSPIKDGEGEFSTFDMVTAPQNSKSKRSSGERPSGRPTRSKAPTSAKISAKMNFDMSADSLSPSKSKKERNRVVPLETSGLRLTVPISKNIDNTTNGPVAVDEMNKKIKSLQRRRKKPNVMFKKFLSILCSDVASERGSSDEIEEAKAFLIYREDIYSNASVDTVKWKSTEEEKPKSFSKTSFDSVVLKALRYENTQQVIGLSSRPKDSCMAIPLRRELPDGSKQNFGVVELVRANVDARLFSKQEQEAAEKFCKAAENLIFDALSKLQSRLKNSMASMFASASTENEQANVVNSPDGKFSVSIKTLDFGFSNVKSSPKKAKGGKARSRKKTSKRGNIDLDLSFPQSSKTVTRPEQEDGEDDPPPSNSMEEQARTVLLDAFAVVTEGNDWENEEWNKTIAQNVISPNGRLSPYKDPFTLKQRKEIEARKTLPVPKLRRRRKPARRPVISSQINKSASKCRAGFKAYIRNAMVESEYLEKKRQLFRPMANRKESATRETFLVPNCDPPVERKPSKSRKPFSRELKILETKGVVSFIKDALKSNKSDLARDYTDAKMDIFKKYNEYNPSSMMLGHSPRIVHNDWRSDRHFAGYIEKEMRSFGRRRRGHTFEQYKSPRRPKPRNRNRDRKRGGGGRRKKRLLRPKPYDVGLPKQKNNAAADEGAENFTGVGMTLDEFFSKN